jgi:hypothetical protein
VTRLHVVIGTNRKNLKPMGIGLNGKKFCGENIITLSLVSKLNTWNYRIST